MTDEEEVTDEETVDEQVSEEQEGPEEPEIISKNDLLTSATERPEVETYEGVRLRGLTGKEHAHVRAQVMNGPRPVDDESRGERNAHEIACWLARGVVEPELKVQEWKTVMGGRPAGEIDDWYERIKELTGIEGVEIKAAKKALREINNDFGGSMSPSNT